MRIVFGILFCLLLVCTTASAYQYEITEPSTQFYSFTGFKWNRPVDQTGDNWDISYVLDISDYTDDGASDTDISNAFISAFNSWGSVATSSISFMQAADNGGNYDYYDNGWDKGESVATALPAVDAGTDLWHANIILGGWLPQEYFEALSAGGGTTILGVNISFGFIPIPGDPSVNIGGTDYYDGDSDGFADFAFCEMYFNDYFDWGIGTGIDIETVALHEIGHAIGLGHSSNTDAVMYPTYGGICTVLYLDDIAGISELYPIPEPTTMLLLGSLATGLFGVACIKRKRS